MPLTRTEELKIDKAVFAVILDEIFKENFPEKKVPNLIYRKNNNQESLLLEEPIFNSEERKILFQKLAAEHQTRHGQSYQGFMGDSNSTISAGEISSAVPVSFDCNFVSSLCKRRSVTKPSARTQPESAQQTQTPSAKTQETLV